MKKSLALVGLLAVAGLGLGVLSGCHKDDVVDPDPTIVDDDGPQETDHDWVETSHVDATCLEAGSVTYTCSICGETETLEVPALGHEWGNAYYINDGGAHQGDWAHTCVRVNNGVVCGELEYLSTEEGVPEGTVLEPTSTEELNAALVDGAVITIPTVEGEDNEPAPFEVNEEITIQEGVSVTIDLGEVGISGASTTDSTGNVAVYSGLIVVQEGGTLTLEGDGSLIQTHKQSAVIVVDYGGTCIVNGGSYMVQADETSSAYTANYTVVNDGTLIINDGFFGTVNSDSSLIINGPDTWITSDKTAEGALQHEGATLEINGGTFLGGKHVVKSSDHGNLTITGGYFDGFIQDTDEFEDVDPSEDLIYDASGSATISGGVFGSTSEGEKQSEGAYKYAVRVGTGTKEEASEEAVALTITGGTFYEGTEGLFNIDAHTDTNYGSIILSASVYESVSSLLTEDSGLTVTQEGSNYVVTAKAADPS